MMIMQLHRPLLSAWAQQTRTSCHYVQTITAIFNQDATPYNPLSHTCPLMRAPVQVTSVSL
jgi:hypothetical protein